MCHPEEEVRMEKAAESSYLVNQLFDSVAFTPGGLWGKDVLLYGTFEGPWEEAYASGLLKPLRRAVRKHFRKIQAYYVGEEAEQMLDCGKRLTMGEQCPKEYDLSKPAVGRVDSHMPQRKSYEDSCRELQRLQILEEGEIPPLPSQSPRLDDEEPFGLRFFRTELSEAKLDELTLPRTFFGRSEAREVSFCGTDLSESAANWNDFVEVDFRDADLSRSDFRGCTFQEVRFAGTSLRNVDFGHCSFTECDFSDADLTGAKLTAETAATLSLSAGQMSVIDLQTNDGEEPD